MKKILVTGAYGQLGSEIKKIAHLYPEFDFTFTDRDTLSLEDSKAIQDCFEQLKPDYCINCAAYTAVDKAETDVELADIINHTAVGVIAECCTKYNCKLVHVSTDYVFDGTSSIPLKEDALTGPINVYGKTKLDGELACMANNKESIIIRTAWVYSEYGNNFVKTMMRLMNERDSISVVNDQIGSPTYAGDLAHVIVEIIHNKNWVPGLYHFSNEGEISWFDFAKDIKSIINSNCEVTGIPASNYPTPAKRPAYSLLDKSKIKETFGITVPYYKDSLQVCIKQLEQ